MPWNCSVCDTYLASTIQQLLSHIGRCHRHDPNFHCVCGIDGCTRTYKKYFSWRKHILRVHKNINEENINENYCHPDVDESWDEYEQPEPAIHEKKRQEALYLLKLQEDCRLPIATVDSVLANTVSIIDDNVSDLQRNVKSCLHNAAIDIKSVPGLEILLSQETLKKRAFEDFDTNTKRVTYYKEYFGLKVNKIYIELWPFRRVYFL